MISVSELSCSFKVSPVTGLCPIWFRLNAFGWPSALPRTTRVSRKNNESGLNTIRGRRSHQFFPFHMPSQTTQRFIGLRYVSGVKVLVN